MSPSVQTAAKPVYYLSDRPEAYEVWGEITIDAARSFAMHIARRAGERFPEIDFRVDGGWHSHQRGMEHVASVIEENWQDWVGELGTN